MSLIPPGQASFGVRGQLLSDLDVARCPVNLSSRKLCGLGGCLHPSAAISGGNCQELPNLVARCR